MFIDFHEPPFPPAPSPPVAPGPRPGPPPLTARQHRVLGWLVGLALGATLFGPLAGAGVIQAGVAVLAAIRGQDRGR